MVFKCCVYGIPPDWYNGTPDKPFFLNGKLVLKSYNIQVYNCIKLYWIKILLYSPSILRYSLIFHPSTSRKNEKNFTCCIKLVSDMMKIRASFHDMLHPMLHSSKTCLAWEMLNAVSESAGYLSCFTAFNQSTKLHCIQSINQASLHSINQPSFTAFNQSTKLHCIQSINQASLHSINQPSFTAFNQSTKLHCIQSINQAYQISETVEELMIEVESWEINIPALCSSEVIEDFFCNKCY